MCDIIIQNVQYNVNREECFFGSDEQIVAKNIKRLREERKLSMDELSKLSGVSKSMLAQIERGGGNRPYHPVEDFKWNEGALRRAHRAPQKPV